MLHIQRSLQHRAVSEGCRIPRSPGGAGLHSGVLPYTVFLELQTLTHVHTGRSN